MTRPQASAGHPILGRGDLVEAIASGQPGILDAVAMQLGLVQRPPKPALPKIEAGVPIEVGIKPAETIDSSGYPRDIESIALWMVTHFASRAPIEPVDDGPAYLKWNSVPSERPQHQLMAPWRAVGPRLRRGLADFKHGKLPDVPALVARVARREFISEIPRQRRRRWGQAFQIVRDLSLRLTPYLHDQQAIVDHFRAFLPPGSLQVADGCSPSSLRQREPHDHAEAEKPSELRIPPAGTQILVLGDLGCLGESAYLWRQWLRWGQELKAQGCHLLALIPCGAQQVPRPLLDTFSVESWQPVRSALDPQSRAALVERLLVLASPALRLEPGLLRDLRLLIPGADDASIETDVWNSDLLSSNHPVAATIDPQVANEKLRPQFEMLPEDLRRNVLLCIRHWRVNVQRAPEIWFEEVLCLSEDSRRLVHEQDLADARASVRELERRRKLAGADGYAVEAWLHGSTSRLTESAFEDSEVGRILRETQRLLHPSRRRVAAGTDPREIPPDTLRGYLLNVNDRQVTISPEPAEQKDATRKSPVASIQSTNQYFEIADDPRSLEDSFWKNGTKPPFVTDFGTDRYGAWFEFELPAGQHKTDAEQITAADTVTQKMRWIPAGEFMMGSPDDEAERFDDEGPQHPVKLTEGFWMAETPCTQELWRAVMQQNPSRFKGENLPVENVSWDDVQTFSQRLSDLIPGLELRLPTEAQWEYACRGGTKTRYWCGDQIDDAQANFGQKIGRTTPVKKYAANPFGLFDVHGNVWEWCQDYCQERYDEGPQVDPRGPEHGSARVIRGGSWFFNARFVRSACRARSPLGVRYADLGFRCMSQSVAEPSEAAAIPVAEQGPQPTRIGEAEKILRARTIRVDARRPAKIEMAPSSQIAVMTDTDEIWFQRITKPEWATAFGRDAYGVFADLQLPTDRDSAGPAVRQRLRWIPPGKFQMGSPADEPGRYENETLHEVTISTGFWMFDSPCPQQLWEAVIGENPSRFPDPLRPVERVNWDQANKFAEELTALVPELTFSLPTEAQWEYACRAGTTTAIYSGPLEILGNANAPALDNIAWYGGNSGHQFDHDQPEDIHQYAWLTEKQYDFSAAGTRRVKQKRPNPWGLYDMLGNVWEWCQDYWQEKYDEEPQVDPSGPDDGSSRVLRGGGWIDGALRRAVGLPRAFVPGVRDGGLGFRCMSSVGQVAEQVSASKGEPRDEAAEKQRTQ